MSRTLWMMKPASAFTVSSVQPEPGWSADSDLPRQQTVEREQALCAGQCSDLRPLTHRPQGGTSHGQGTHFRVYLEKSMCFSTFSTSPICWALSPLSTVFIVTNVRLLQRVSEQSTS